MTGKSYFYEIFKKYRWFILIFEALYLFCWVYSFWAGTIDGERPSIVVTLVKFIIFTLVLALPSAIIFFDSLKRKKYSGGYVVAGLVLNVYALGAYWLKRKKEKDSEENKSLE
jgi:hypothetical protein